VHAPLNSAELALPFAPAPALPVEAMEVRLAERTLLRGIRMAEGVVLLRALRALQTRVPGGDSEVFGRGVRGHAQVVQRTQGRRPDALRRGTAERAEFSRIGRD
jgi:hypothetical protein